jgi:hypothetical protein
LTAREARALPEFAPPHVAAAGVIFSGQNFCRAQSQKMKTLVDSVIHYRKAAYGEMVSETCIVMTRRIRRFFVNRSRTTVFPGEDCDSTPGFMVFWNSDDPTILRLVHTGMIQIISRIGFTEPAVWCDRRHLNRNPKSLEYFWQEQLGDLFRYYRKAI